MADHPLELTPDRLADLRALRAADKFGPEMSLFYPGAPTDEVRIKSEGHINSLIDRLLEALATDPRKNVALEEFRKDLLHFETSDSEERDRACSYLEQIMDILGIDSSDGLLNSWRYGFDPMEGTK